MGQALCHCSTKSLLHKVIAPQGCCSAALYSIPKACYQLVTLQVHCPIRSPLAVVHACLLQEWLQIDKQVAMIALGRFESCVRSTLLLCEGYECCEKDGMFTAFPQGCTTVGSYSAAGSYQVCHPADHAMPMILPPAALLRQ